MIGEINPVAAIWVILALRSNHSPQKTVRVSVKIADKSGIFTVLVVFKIGQYPLVFWHKLDKPDPCTTGRIEIE